MSDLWNKTTIKLERTFSYIEKDDIVSENAAVIGVCFDEVHDEGYYEKNVEISQAEMLVYLSLGH